MIKTLVYVPDPASTKSLDEIESWGRTNGKLRVCLVNNGQDAYGLGKGAHVVTSKGHELYVVDTKEGHVQIPGAKPMGISGIVEVSYPFGGAPVTSSSKQVTTFTDKIKNMFMPARTPDIRMSLDGNICVEHNGEFIGIDANNNLTAYPKEVTIKVPAFVISKKKEDVKVGDIILVNSRYGKVTSIKDGAITYLGFTGVSHNTKTVKDFVLQQSIVKVVITINNLNSMGSVNGMNPLMLALLTEKEQKGTTSSCSKKKGTLDKVLPLMMLSGNCNLAGGQNNLLPLMLLSGEGESDSLLPLALMSQNGQAGANNNNLMALALMGEDGLGSGNALETMCMMQMMGGCNLFGGQPVAEAPKA